MGQPWYWTHDASAAHALEPPRPPFRLARVIPYGAGRYATLVHAGPGLPRQAALDLDERQAGAVRDPVAVAAGEGRFAVVTEPGRPVPSRLRTGLTADAVTALLAAGDRLLDLAPYATADGPRFAVVTAPDGPGTGLRIGRRRWGLRAVRLRPLGDGRYAAVTGDAGGRVRCHAGIGADAVGRRLDRRDAWPLDLDAVRTAGGVRYTLIVRT